MAKATKSASAAQDAMSAFSEAVETVQSKMEVPAAARDFVKRIATDAQERAENLHQDVTTATHRAETFATSLVSGYADFTRGLVEASLANARHAFATVEKVATAKSLNEAAQIQIDFVRDSARSNFERARDAAEAARIAAAEGVKTIQSEISALYTKKAA